MQDFKKNDKNKANKLAYELKRNGKCKLWLARVIFKTQQFSK
jgi:hypothetical protein